MSKLFSAILFSCFLLSQTITFAEEGDVERLVVPEAHEVPTSTDESENSEEVVEEIIQEEEPQAIEEKIDIVQVPAEITQTEITQTEQAETPVDAEEPTKQIQEEVAEEASIEKSPVEEVASEDELEAMQAEEAELREVGAGEEPAIE